MGEAKKKSSHSISIEKNVNMVALVVLDVDGSFQDVQFVTADVHDEFVPRLTAAALPTGPSRYGLFKRQGGRVVDAVSPVDFFSGQSRDQWSVVKLTSLKNLNGPCDLSDEENMLASYAQCSYLMTQGYAASDGGAKAVLRGKILLEIPEVWHYARLSGRNLSRYDQDLKRIFSDPQRFLISRGRDVIRAWFADEKIIDQLQTVLYPGAVAA